MPSSKNLFSVHILLGHSTTMSKPSSHCPFCFLLACFQDFPCNNLPFAFSASFSCLLMNSFQSLSSHWLSASSPSPSLSYFLLALFSVFSTCAHLNSNPVSFHVISFHLVVLVTSTGNSLITGFLFVCFFCFFYGMPHWIANLKKTKLDEFS